MYVLRADEQPGSFNIFWLDFLQSLIMKIKLCVGELIVQFSIKTAKINIDNWIN